MEAPFCFIDNSKREEYEKGISLDKIFSIFSTGIKSHRDNLVINTSKENLISNIDTFFNENIDDINVKNILKLKDNADWKLADARNSLSKDYNLISTVLYRPFDIRSIYYEIGMMDRHRENVMKHMTSPNLALVVPKQTSEKENNGGFVTNGYAIHKSYSAYNTNYFFPLYIYNNADLLSAKTSNIKREVVGLFLESLNPNNESVSEQNIFDYILAIINSPLYQNTYKDLLKSRFPKIPIPKNRIIFDEYSTYGRELREIQTLQSNRLTKIISSYPIAGDNKIENKIISKDWEIYDTENSTGRIWINETQYFDEIPNSVWNCYIGGYQPAKKWLKDRVNSILNYDDIQHYQKIITAINESQKLKEKLEKLPI